MSRIKIEIFALVLLFICGFFCFGCIPGHTNEYQVAYSKEDNAYILSHYEGEFKELRPQFFQAVEQGLRQAD